MKYASGKRALGICDRCGLTYKLNTLKDETVRAMARNVLVCVTCWDSDHPQNWSGSETPVDAEVLQDPRPDTDPGR